MQPSAALRRAAPSPSPTLLAAPCCLRDALPWQQQQGRQQQRHPRRRGSAVTPPLAMATRTASPSSCLTPILRRRGCRPPPPRNGVPGVAYAAAAVADGDSGTPRLRRAAIGAIGAAGADAAARGRRSGGGGGGAVARAQSGGRGMSSAGDAFQDDGFDDEGQGFGIDDDLGADGGGGAGGLPGDLDDLRSIGLGDLELDFGGPGGSEFAPSSGLYDLGDEAFAAGEGEERLDGDGDVLAQLSGKLAFGDDEAGGVEEDAGEPEAAAQAPESRWPDVPERGYYLSDLFGKAAYVADAELLDADHPDAVVYGLQSDPSKIIEGDMYVCTSDDPSAVPQLVADAMANAPAALLLPLSVAEAGAADLGLPQDMPVVYVASVEEVAQRLAVAFYDAPSRGMLCIGVLGDRGKTTTAALVSGVLARMREVSGSLSSVGFLLDGDRLDADGELHVAPHDDNVDEHESSAPFRVTPYHPGRYRVQSATPPGLQVQKLLAGMRDRGATCAVLELGSAALAEGRADFTELSVAVHTGCGGSARRAAMPQAGGATGTAAAATASAAELAAQLGVFDGLLDPSAQAAVVNLDDAATPQILERLGSVPVVTYGIDRTDADVVAESASFTIWESELMIRTPLGKLQIITQLIGKHNAYNVLAAVATGIALAVPLVDIVAGIESVEVVPGRCEVIDEGQDFSVIVDAADTPQALDAVLSALRGNAKNVYTVLGCRGEEDRSTRAQMAEVAHALSDVVIMTNDSPRREPPEHIIKDMVAGLPDEIVNRYSGYVYFPFQDQGHVPLWFEPYLQKAQRDSRRYIMEDRFSAIRAAIGTAGPNDVVVIAGRGADDCMEYWDGEEPAGIVRGWFDDRIEARSALQKLSVLQQLDGKLERKVLPWGKALDQMDTIITM